MKINILGSGHGMAINCYNTCFTIENDGKHFLVDAGGGNGIIKNLNKLNISLESLDSMFISHIHLDHILGSLWIIRALLPKYYHNKIQKDFLVYGNEEVISTLIKLTELLMPNDFRFLLQTKIKFISVSNNSRFTILDKEVFFFDADGKKSVQYGFSMNIDNGKKFTFIGDEFCKENTKKYIENSEWLFADAYMCGLEAENYNPIKKHCHSTVKYISKIAQDLRVKNLILSHTIDNDLENRQKNFKEDSSKYFDGNILIPDDLDVILM